MATQICGLWETLKKHRFDLRVEPLKNSSTKGISVLTPVSVALYNKKGMGGGLCRYDEFNGIDKGRLSWTVKVGPKCDPGYSS